MNNNYKERLKTITLKKNFALARKCKQNSGYMTKTNINAKKYKKALLFQIFHREKDREGIGENY